MNKKSLLLLPALFCLGLSACSFSSEVESSSSQVSSSEKLEAVWSNKMKKMFETYLGGHELPIFDASQMKLETKLGYYSGITFIEEECAPDAINFYTKYFNQNSYLIINSKLEDDLIVKQAKLRRNYLEEGIVEINLVQEHRLNGFDVLTIDTNYFNNKEFPQRAFNDVYGRDVDFPEFDALLYEVDFSSLEREGYITIKCHRNAAISVSDLNNYLQEIIKDGYNLAHQSDQSDLATKGDVKVQIKVEDDILTLKVFSPNN